MVFASVAPRPFEREPSGTATHPLTTTTPSKSITVFRIFAVLPRAGRDIYSFEEFVDKLEMKILMVGAAGKYAHDVLPALKARGATVKALVTSENKRAEAIAQGADQTVVGDLNDEQSLRTAAQGADGVFHLNPAFAPNEAELGVAMVNAAVAAGVKKFTFSSVIHPSISKMRNHSAKRPVEEALFESGLTFTVLQPTMFMQTLAGGWKEVIERSTFSLPYPNDKRASYVDYRDVAEAAAIALTSDQLDYGTFELCARGMLDRVELTRIMSKVLGRTITPVEITFDEWVKRTRTPEGPFRDGMQRMYADYAQYGFPGGNALVLRAILRREPRTLKDFFKEQVNAQR